MSLAVGGLCLSLPLPTTEPNASPRTLGGCRSGEDLAAPSGTGSARPSASRRFPDVRLSPAAPHHRRHTHTPRAHQENYDDIANLPDSGHEGNYAATLGNTAPWKDKIRVCRNWTTVCRADRRRVLRLRSAPRADTADPARLALPLVFRAHVAGSDPSAFFAPPPGPLSVRGCST